MPAIKSGYYVILKVVFDQFALAVLFIQVSQSDEHLSTSLIQNTDLFCAKLLWTINGIKNCYFYILDL